MPGSRRLLQGKLFQLIVNLSRPSSSSLLQRSSSVPMTLSRPKTAPTDFIAVSTLSGLTGFGPEEQKPELIQDLKKEIPGIFNWALEGLERLSEQEWQMTRSRFMEGCHDEFRSDLANFFESIFFPTRSKTLMRIKTERSIHRTPKLRLIMLNQK